MMRQEIYNCVKSLKFWILKRLQESFISRVVRSIPFHYIVVTVTILTKTTDSSIYI